MRSEWRTVTLGDVCNLRAGAAFSPSLQGQLVGKYPFIKVGDMNLAANAICIRESNNWVDEAERQVLKAKPLPPGTTVFAKIGEALKQNRLRLLVQETIIDNNMMGAVPRDGVIDARFLFYSLSQVDFGRIAVGTALPYLTQATLAQLPLKLPIIEEQCAISRVLSSIDDKVELNRRLSETLEAIARALFKSWFIDFDPVRAKMVGRVPTGMDDGVAALFPSSFHDSDVGPIPAGWTFGHLGSWVDALSGGTPSKTMASYWGGDIPWISPKVMTSIHADHADEFVTEAAIGNGTRLAPSGATLVMVRGMGLHERVRVSQVRREATFNQDVKALVPRNIEASLLLHSLLHGQQELLGKVESSGHGTGKLPTEILLGYPVTMPPAEVQAELTKIFDGIGARIAAAREETRTLEELRRQLLPTLLSGDLRVGNFARQVESVV